MGRRRSGAVGTVQPVALAVAALSCVALSGCAQPRAAAAPEPEFTSGRPAVATAPVASLPPVTAEQPDLDAVEPDVPQPDIDQMLVLDDAGNAAPNASGWASFDAALGRRLVPANVSASVAVMLDGELVHQQAFGERVALSGEPADISDRFRIGSVSKTITAIVTMQLVDDGLLTLDDPVGQLLIDHLLVADADPDVAGITVRELLSHTAGFPDHQHTFFGNGAASYLDAVRTGLRSGVGSGGGYNYSNMGYAALGVLIEAVTGKAYERVVAERLLIPLGISDMRITATHELGPDEVSHHPLPGRTYMEALGGAGAWNATPAQLVTILDSIDPSTDGWKALSPASMAAMRYRQQNAFAPGGYGLGIINYPGEAWGHTGTIEHAHTMVLAEPGGLTWAIAVSGDSPSNTEALRSVMRSAMAAAFPSA